MTPRVWVFTLVRNEHVLMPYWLRHYGAFCDRMVVFVDSTTEDDTAAIALAYGADVRAYPSNGFLDDEAFVGLANRTYREARGHADWIVWVDGDEFVYHPRILDQLTHFRANGVNLPRTEGWAMMSHGPPVGDGQIWQEITRGIPASAYSKIAVFDPELELEWEPGKHTANIHSAYRLDDGSDPLLLLHYRWLGSAWMRTRSNGNWSRVPPRLRSWAGKENAPDSIGEYSPAWFEGRIELAREVINRVSVSVA